MGEEEVGAVWPEDVLARPPSDKFGLFTTLKCGGSVPPLKMEMGEDRETKAQCFWLVYIINFSLGI